MTDEDLKYVLEKIRNSHLESAKDICRLKSAAKRVRIQKKQQKNKVRRTKKMMKAYKPVKRHPRISKTQILTHFPTMPSLPSSPKMTFASYPANKPSTAPCSSQTNRSLNSKIKKLNLKTIRKKNRHSEGRIMCDLGSAIESSNKNYQQREGYKLSNGKLKIGDFNLSQYGLIYDGEVYNTRPSEYFPLSILGRGSCGVVYKAWHIPTRKLVALKAISFRDPEKRSQVLKELRAYKKYECSNVKFQGAHFHDDHIWLALEYFPCGSLEEIREKHGKFNEAEISLLTKQILEGLLKLHSKQIIHRDIKPSNLLLHRSGSCKIADFGILIKLENETRSCNSVVGTHFYMSPERLRGNSYSYPADIWSLGITVATIALGFFPFETQCEYTQALFHDEPFINLLFPDHNDVSPLVYDFVKHCVGRDPAARSSANELLSHPLIKSFSISLPHFSWKQYDAVNRRVRLEECCHICRHLIEKHETSHLTEREFDRLASELSIEKNHAKRIFGNILLGHILRDTEL